MEPNNQDIANDIVNMIMMQADIDALLNVEPEEELHHFNPYALELVKIDENKFVNGAKALPSTSKPLKLASKDKFVSEMNVIGLQGNELNGLCFANMVQIPCAEAIMRHIYEEILGM